MAKQIITEGSGVYWTVQVDKLNDNFTENYDAIALNTVKVSYPSADSTKLAGIEALADVTDATNVAAAGGVLNSGNEVIADIKTFSTAPIVPYQAYGSLWSISLEPPTKRAVYDKIESLAGGHDPVTINATDNGLSVNASQVLTLGLASTTTIGALSDTDWNTFNNKSTDLSEGTSTTTTVDVDSSSGANATLAAASTSRAGLLTKAKWDEIVVNTAKVTYPSADSTKLAGIEALAEVNRTLDANPTNGNITNSASSNGIFDALALKQDLAIVTNSKATAYTVGTDDALESYSGVIYVTSAAVITLPAVADGMSVRIITIGAIAVSAKPNASDKLVLDGVTLDDGDKATNTSTTGDEIVLTYYSADGWYASSIGPSWTDDGA